MFIIITQGNYNNNKLKCSTKGQSGKYTKTVLEKAKINLATIMNEQPEDRVIVLTVINI